MDDWDNLVVLDSCRFDALRFFQEKLFWLNGELEEEWREKPRTADFVDRNLRNMDDTIAYSTWHEFSRGDHDLCKCKGISVPEGFEYNPESNFRKVRECFSKKILDRWGAVPPERAFRNFRDKYEPGEKSLFWMCQPREPFLGPFRLNYRGTSPYRTKRVDKKSVIRKAYSDNLLEVLYWIGVLEEEVLEGETVIISNHGESLGEKRVYGHDYGNTSDEVLKTPRFSPDLELNPRRIGLERFIKLAYESVLGREADETGLRNKMKLFRTRSNFSRTSIISILMDSEEGVSKTSLWESQKR